MKSQQTLDVVNKSHKQMLKLVARSFFKELINYGVNGAEVLNVATHLLDNILQEGGRKSPDRESYNKLFTMNDVRDSWQLAQRLDLTEVGLVPMRMELVPQISAWCRSPTIRESFYPPFPESEVALTNYFSVPGRCYFVILHQNVPLGIIGAENIDTNSSKLEMRKLIGDQGMHGKGIGKRATFLFMYHVFHILKFEKIYIHSMDTNIRNLNLNAKFGFELEGVFLEDVLIGQQRRDVVRMALSRPVWLELFSGACPSASSSLKDESS